MADAKRTSRLEDAETLNQPGGPAGGPTITDLFMGGYDGVYFEPDELNPAKPSINARHSWKQAGDDEGIAKEIIDSIQHVPDPPCIMPFEAEEDEDATAYEEIPMKDYWKEWAMWVETWPKIREYKQEVDTFRHTWHNRSYDSRLRAYVSMSKNSIGVRRNVGTDMEAMTGQAVLPGMPIGIENWKEVGRSRYVKLPGPGAGWVLDTNEGTPLLAEMKYTEILQDGSGWHRVVTNEFVEIRRYPSYDDDARSGWILSPREIVVVALKCKVNGHGFFLLADGRGWVFELKPGVAKNNKDVQNLILLPCEDEFVDGEDAAILKNLVLPTNEVVEVGMWTYIVNVQPVLAVGGHRTGVFLTPGDVVKVDKRANSNGNPPGLGGPGIQNRRWLRVAQHKAWAPETNEHGQKLLLEQANDEVAYPSWFRPGKNVNEITETWHAGMM